ncbi:MAG: toll/interleukin-1 receptor domain-containing protein [Limimaricola soesokkakensis]|uniref:toll/interleukin-1 receptor domain-containing protein n=1 Tax=Limimaricola soesokkakensis TaxID=1343159 RepID=UPI0040598444
MPLETRPFLAVYIAWHPAFRHGKDIATNLFNHYRREHFGNIAGGAGLSVVYRYASDPATGTPLDIDFEEAETSAVVVLFDEEFSKSAKYMGWLKTVSLSSDNSGMRSMVFPVAMDASLTKSGIFEQAVRWDLWGQIQDPQIKLRKLTTDLTYQFSRMLRSYLERLRRPLTEDEALLGHLQKVQIFLSHSKHDGDGERIAKAVRGELYDAQGLGSFFDVKDIPTGTRFDRVLLAQVRVSAVVAIHTDSFSSREWCRREIIEAKRHNVPLVVANCIQDADERGFPYLGNVPVVRMEPELLNRIDSIVGRLLDEVLKDFLWRCRVETVQQTSGGNAIFLPRPPELISLACLNRETQSETTLVYPDPPIGAEEQRLFEVIAPLVKLRSITEWIAESGVQK